MGEFLRRAARTAVDDDASVDTQAPRHREAMINIDALTPDSSHWFLGFSIGARAKFDCGAGGEFLA